MVFDSWTAFFHMGNYGVYVWSAYGLGALALVGLGLDTLISRRKELNKLKKRYIRESKS
ncbi:Heme exporter protein D (CcmD) [Marinomonas spartinae]|uniref:Heme exporter protein D n=1 Tax=Marinomonas spartinae TaxID=1792290 RepID=A0A1A8TJ38_9GAMM|nr:heme exporter protein CcmD [Marinomonas spartinae]SBS32823.1 Heme exporter protein D (CcmD) [Marinomonas spartinae]